MEPFEQRMEPRDPGRSFERLSPRRVDTMSALVGGGSRGVDTVSGPVRSESTRLDTASTDIDTVSIAVDSPPC